MITTLQRKYQDWKSRFLSDYEWDMEWGAQNQELILRIFVERKPTALIFMFENCPEADVKNIKMASGGDDVSVDYHIERTQDEAGLLLSVALKQPVYTTKLAILLSGTDRRKNFRVQVKAIKDNSLDLHLLQAGIDGAKQGEYKYAIDQLHEYEEVSNDNPIACGVLANAYRECQQYDMAEQYALKTIVHGNYPDGLALYRDIQVERPSSPDTEIRDLQKRSSEWNTESHHGLIVLQRYQQVLFLPNGWHLKRTRRLVEVRRAAAARMLRSQGFLYSATNEFLLHTGLRVHHTNNEVEEVPEEYFTVSDSESQNIFITVEDEKAGLWILPDLESGDVVELTHHLLCREMKIKGNGDGFIVTRIYDSLEPTYDGKVEVVVPKGKKLKFVTRNGSLERATRDSEDGGHVVHEFHGTCHVPSKYTGNGYEHNQLNPILACAAEGVTWADVSQVSREANFGNPDDVGDDLPETLRNMLQGHAGRSEALEHAFYWIRDRLKYASLQTGSERVGTTSRAQAILDSGTADCKDKSHLLALVCRELEIPFEFLAVSTQRGIMIQELPAQQFDHVFVRAKPEAEWVYMDAASTYSSYGPAPVWCQGMEVMVVDEAGTIITIPDDEPGTNALEIEESFSGISDGWLEGAFSFKAWAHSGRTANEQWKAMSMTLVDQLQAAQESLKHYLPFAMVSGFELCADTGASSMFHVHGRHQRCSLVSLEKRKTRIGRLIWGVPHLPISYWRVLQIERMFVVECPIEVRIQVRFEGDVFRRINDVSSLKPFQNDICSIHEETQKDSESLTIRRTIAFRKKTIVGSEVELVPGILERIEKALQLVVALDE